MITRRLSAAAGLLLVAHPVLAHPGHVAEQAGHSHWIVYGAAGLALLIGAGAVALAWRRVVKRGR